MDSSISNAPARSSDEMDDVQATGVSSVGGTLLPTGHHFVTSTPVDSNSDPIGTEEAAIEKEADEELAEIENDAGNKVDRWAATAGNKDERVVTELPLQVQFKEAPAVYNQIRSHASTVAAIRHINSRRTRRRTHSSRKMSPRNAPWSSVPLWT